MVPEILVNVYLDGGNQITAQSGGRGATGWIYLFLTHSDDIIKYCGVKVVARHFLNAGSRLLNEENSNFSAAQMAVALALGYRASPLNVFRFILLKITPGFLRRRRPVVRLLKHLVRGRF
ncbi:MAG: hypothetical protein LBJ14_10165 [Desulfarculales bacterium]|jgi:hypothetical protein|nr:hypothetical protein [Desulfarculales bacterium]